MSRGEVIELKRGQVLTSHLALADRWRWNRDRVRGFIALLERMGELKVISGPRRTILTICNYSKWQDLTPTDRATDPQQTPNRPATDRHVQQSEPSEPAKPKDVRPYVTESLGNGGNGNGNGSGRNRAEQSDDRELQAIKVVAHCQHTAEDVLGHKLADLDAVPKMRKLLTVRDAATIQEVFDHFAGTRRKQDTLNFHNFFTYYEQHERDTI